MLVSTVALPSTADNLLDSKVSRTKRLVNAFHYVFVLHTSIIDCKSLLSSVKNVTNIDTIFNYTKKILIIFSISA